MKLKFTILIIIFGAFTPALGSMKRGNFKDPKHPGKCNMGIKVLEPGRHRLIENKCMEVYCHANSIATIQTCPLKVGQSKCKKINPAAEFPDCCKRSCSGSSASAPAPAPAPAAGARR